MATLKRVVKLNETITASQAEIARLLGGRGSRVASSNVVKVSRKSKTVKRNKSGKRDAAWAAKISAGLKAKWAERKAKASAAPPVPTGSVTPATSAPAVAVAA